MTGDLSTLIKQAQDLQSKVNRVLDELRYEKVQGTAGGGVVTATLNGLQDVIDLSISDEVINVEDKELLEEMIVAAINNGRQKAMEIKNTKLNQMTGGMLMPNMLANI